MNNAEPNPVSVVIPTRNRPDLVRRAVKSALDQTLAPTEVVVVIDGPDVPTQVALRQFNHPAVRIVQLPRSFGGASARNAGVAAARGEWIAFLDDDDEWMPLKLARQLPLAINSIAAYPVIASAVIARTPRVDFVWPRKAPTLPISEYLFSRASWTQGEALLQTSTLLTKKDLLLKVPFTEGLPRHQDWDWLLRATTRGDISIEFLPEPLAIWNIEQHRNTISTTSDWKFSLQWIRQNRPLVTKRAYAGFFATQLSSQASKEAFWSAFFPLLWEAIRDGAPSSRDLLLYMLIWFSPQSFRRWARSLHSGFRRQTA
jgi:glycosyltransferase involved in cell wall biosynthesis